VIHSFGRADKVDRAALARLVTSISRFLTPEQAVTAAVGVGELGGGVEVLDSRRLGAAWTLDRLWERLGIGAAIRRVATGRRLDGDVVERVVFALVAQRACEPGSKLAATGWVAERVAIDRCPGFTHDAAYAAMDFLLDALGEIAAEVFSSVAHLLNLDLDIVFVDTTSTYWETETIDELADLADDPIDDETTSPTEAAAALARPGRYRTVSDNLRVKEVAVAPGGDGDGDDGARTQRFVICHNPEQADRDSAVRANLVAHLQQLIDGSDSWTGRRRDELVGSLKAKPGLRRYLRRTPSGLLRVDHAAIKRETHLDGKWLLRTSDLTLTPDDLAAAYKQLLAVERGWRDFKGALGLRPVFHHREDRIRGHIQLCWLALLLLRVIENATGDTWRKTRHELDRMHLVTLATNAGQVAQRSATTPGQQTILRALDLPEPPKFFNFTLPDSR